MEANQFHAIPMVLNNQKVVNIKEMKKYLIKISFGLLTDTKIHIYDMNTDTLYLKSLANYLKISPN